MLFFRAKDRGHRYEGVVLVGRPFDSTESGTFRGHHPFSFRIRRRACMLAVDVGGAPLNVETGRVAWFESGFGIPRFLRLSLSGGVAMLLPFEGTGRAEGVGGRSGKCV